MNATLLKVNLPAIGLSRRRWQAGRQARPTLFGRETSVKHFENPIVKLGLRFLKNEMFAGKHFHIY